MIDERLQRRVKQDGRKLKKKKEDKARFDRRLKEAKIKCINYYKQHHDCVICHENSPCCLEFHHVNPEIKDFTISSAVCNIKINVRTLKKEIHKCVILCSNCHKKLHSNELNVELLQEILNS